MTIKSQKDFLAGTIFLVIGVCFAYASAQYRLGTPGRMGPGFFPLILGSALGLLGAAVMFGACRGEPVEDGKLEALNLRGLFLIVAATCAFALLIQPMGLLFTLAACAAITTFAAPAARPRTVMANIAVQLVIGLGIFHVLLKLQIPLLPTIFGF